MPPESGTPIPFFKAEGCGNDYVFVPLADVGEPTAAKLRARLPELAKLWSHRRFGIGADGVVLIEPPQGDIAATLAMANADGSRGELCVNALRCVARWLVERRDAPSELLLRSGAGAHAARVELVDGGRCWVELEVGYPRTAPEQIPLDPTKCQAFAQTDAAPAEIVLEVDAQRFEGLALSMGNPHLILPLGQPPAGFPVARVGPLLEHHPAFPERVNVSFVHLDATGELLQRTWERGSGETLACGSGAAAARVALGHLLGLPKSQDLIVRLPGGSLTLRQADDERVLLGGPARIVFEGRTELI